MVINKKKLALEKIAKGLLIIGESPMYAILSITTYTSSHPSKQFNENLEDLKIFHQENIEKGEKFTSRIYDKYFKNDNGN